eukprot:c6991_g1_i3.p1 GENE.c6991_g1_i3~~c6991_g1_i3.p1  ORF type:complete len:1039 (-),score=298.76 c6991_g1_i3:48-3164(-)
MNLAEQFSQHMNRYFLFIACLQLIPEITPVHPASTWTPLIIVLVLSAAKEGFDDLRRYERDRKLNKSVVHVIVDGVEQDIASSDIHVGDLVRLSNNEPSPCDLCIVTSSTDLGSCYIQTTNLDGESDYKTRQAHREVHECVKQTKGDYPKINGFQATIHCNNPNSDVYEFNAVMYVPFASDPTAALSLSSKQLIPQSAIVRHTDYVWGVAVYTGNQTKLGMNKKQPKMKWTSAESFINRLSLIIFILQLFIVVLFGAVGNYLKNTDQQEMFYLSLSSDLTSSRWYHALVVPARFLLLCSMMIPISLKVTLDFSRAFYAKLIEWDENMHDPVTDRYATSNNTAISEDLGQIDIILTDKTGTLTQNLMVFQKCLIGNMLYNEDALHDVSLQQRLQQLDSETLIFFRALALCHSVVPQQLSDGTFEYRSSSPDEEALVKAAAHSGIVFENKTATSLFVNVRETIEQYDVMHSLEFTSSRKKMSVLLRRLDGTFLLLCKGADDVILPALSTNAPSARERLDNAKSALETFASQGLRTLCVASREVTLEEFEAFSKALQTANCQLADRETELAVVYDSLERNLDLLGVTAIEDKLQEGVPETIADIREAGVSFWMLTGDKYSTALQIAVACNLRNPTQPLVSLEGSLNEYELVDVLRAEIGRHVITDKDHHVCAPTVIVTSKVLNVILESPILRSQFQELCRLAETVVCCRVTPLQKALIVQFAKESGARTLAIGDGGNDVNMIQQAHVGVGIDGREGQQAARAADYAIAKFRYLRQLLFVHGHLSYHRTAVIAQYSFYKSLLICCVQLIYATATSFSGASLFNSVSLMGFNVVYTGLLAFTFVLDRQVDPKALSQWSRWYRYIRENHILNSQTFISWGLRGMYQALFVCVIIFATFSNRYLSNSGGRTFGNEELGLIVFTCLVWIQIITILVLETKRLTVPTTVVVIGTLIVFYALNLALSLAPHLSMYGVMFRLADERGCWFAIILAVAVALIPVVVAKAWWSGANSNVRDNKQNIRMELIQPLSDNDLEMELVRNTDDDW